MAAKAAAAPETTTPQLNIARISTETLRVPLLGTAPLIVHKFSEKAKRQMLDAMQGRKNPKAPRDPEADYLASMYRHDDGGYGVPVIAFKNATVSAARLYDKSVSMTGLRQLMFFDAEFSKTDGQKLARLDAEPHMREDVVRVGVGGTDLRYRAEFTEWATTIDVTFIASQLTRESVLSLIDAGGMTVGVSEWRPEKKGDFGTFCIDPTREVVVL